MQEDFDPICYLLYARNNMISYAIKTVKELPKSVKKFYNVNNEQSKEISAEQIMQILLSLEPWSPNDTEISDLEHFLVENISDLFDVDLQQHLIDRLDIIFVLSSIHSNRYPVKYKEWIYECLALDMFEVTELYNNQLEITDFVASIHRVLNVDISPSDWIEYLMMFIKNRKPKHSKHIQNKLLQQNHTENNSYISQTAQLLLKKTREHLGIYQFVIDRTVLLIILFPDAIDIFKKGCRLPHKINNLDTSDTSVEILDELICKLLPLHDVGVSNKILTIDLLFYYDKILHSMSEKK
jgi:hypothetical protein